MKYEKYPGELYHFGVKGMKWGIRRTRKQLGYKDNPKKLKTTHRQRLEEKYIKQGYSKDKAKAYAERRIRTEKSIAVIGGVAVTAAAAYLVHKHVKNSVDQIIKSGTSLQRIEGNVSKIELHDVFYASNNKKDNTMYKAFYGDNRHFGTGKANILNIVAKKDLKVASRNNSKKIFNDLYKNDSDFKKLIDEFRPYKPKNMSDYDLFNQKIPNLNDLKGTIDENRIKKQYDKFFKALKDKGYDAIQDVNDMKYSGYNTKNPLIFINAQNKVNLDSYKELLMKDIDSAKVDARAQLAKDYSLKKITKLSAISVSGAAVSGAAAYANQPTNKYKNVN